MGISTKSSGIIIMLVNIFIHAEQDIIIVRFRPQIVSQTIQPPFWNKETPLPPFLERHSCPKKLYVRAPVQPVAEVRSWSGDLVLTFFSYHMRNETSWISWGRRFDHVKRQAVGCWGLI